MTLSPPPDVYNILGVSRSATAAEIRSSYRKLVLTCHPDKILDLSLKAAKQAEFQKVQEAYEILSDENRRQDHDEKVQIYELRKEMGRGNPTARSNPFEFEVKTPKSSEPSKPKSTSSTSSIRIYTYTNAHNTSSSKAQEDSKYQSKHTSKKSPGENPDRKRSSAKDDEQRRAAAHAKRLSEERERQREKELKREKKKAKEKKEKDRKQGSEEKRSKKTYAFVEDDTEDDPLFSPFSDSKPSKYDTDDLHDSGVKARDAKSTSAKASPDSGRKETSHPQQAPRPAEKRSTRTSTKDVPLSDKWNEHRDFAGRYMQAVRQKAAAPQVPPPPSGPQRAQSYDMPTSSVYNVPSPSTPRYTTVPNVSFSPRYSTTSNPPPTPRYSEEESTSRPSRRRERKYSSDIPPTRKKTKDVSSDSYPGELRQPHVVEPPSPPPSGRKVFPKEKPQTSEKYTYVPAQESARRSGTIPPLSRSQTYAEPQSRNRKPELSSESESESPSVPRYHHPFTVNYSLENNRATTANTSRYRSEHRPVDEYFPMRNVSPHSRAHIYRNPSVSEYRGSHSYPQNFYYPPEGENYARHMHSYPLQREPVSQQPPLGNISFAPTFRHENLIFGTTPAQAYGSQIYGRG